MSMISTDFHNLPTYNSPGRLISHDEAAWRWKRKNRDPRFFRVGALIVPSSPAVQAILFCPSSRNYSCHLSLSWLWILCIHQQGWVSILPARRIQDYDLGPFSSNVIKFVECSFCISGCLIDNSEYAITEDAEPNVSIPINFPHCHLIYKDRY